MKKQNKKFNDLVHTPREPLVKHQDKRQKEKEDLQNFKWLLK
jgi:hypothetical protein